MPRIELQTTILADVKTCFDLARNIDFHQESLKFSQEIAIAGVTSGLINLGETVTWEAKHFGFVQHLTSKITELDAPHYFVSEMVSGTFKTLKHKHIFKKVDDATLMIDEFYFESPYGIIGKFANWLFLKRYMIRFLKIRNATLKDTAEASRLIKLAS